MILNTNTIKCDTNMDKGTSFKITANAKMFKILSSGLYSNKIKAIIRELSCNALDANIEAGNKNRIDIHLPNTLEPYFSVRDSGFGLSPESMNEVYTTYGASTKTERNDLIGALGLGSKSPFGYVGVFTVTSIHNGIKTVYSAYIDTNGEPQLQSFGEGTITQEQSGLEVQLPVEEKDFNNFKIEAQNVFRAFDIRPNIVGNSSYKIEELSIEIDTKYGQIINNGYYLAVQGNIEYNINPDLIRQKISLINKQYLLIMFISYFKLNFDIGELDIAASREELGYDDITINNIITKMDLLYTEIFNIINKEIDNCETLYEARRLLYLYQAKTSIVNSKEIFYKGNILSTKIKIDKTILPVEDIVIYTLERGKISRDTPINYGNYFIFSVNNDNIGFVLNDNNNKVQSVRKARQLTSQYDKVVLINDIKFINAIGNPEYIKASELKIKQNSKANTKKIVSGRHFKNGNLSFDKYFNTPYQTQDKIGIDLDSEFYYVEIKGCMSVKGISIGSYYRLVKELNLLDKPIYGISTKFVNSKKFKELKGIEFISNMKSKIESHPRFKKVLKAINLKYSIDYIDCLTQKEIVLVKNTELVSMLEYNKELKEINEHYNKVNKLLVKDTIMKHIENLPNIFNIKRKYENKYINLNLVEKYPLLNSIYIRSGNYKAIADYINAMDYKNICENKINEAI